MQRIPLLKPADIGSRLECQWITTNPRAIYNILCTAEALFTFDEVYKGSGSQDHNHPQGTFENNYQHFYSVNLQYGVVLLVTNSLDCTPAG
jgi:hypothetical protein